MNKKQIRYIYIFAALLCLVLSALFWGPEALNRYVNQESVKNRLHNYLCRELNLQLGFENISFAIFPAPHIEVKGPELNLDSGWGQTSAAQLQVFPHLMSLFKGKWEIDKLVLLKPEWSLPNINPLDVIVINPETSLKNEIEDLLKTLPLPDKTLDLEIKKGRISTKAGKYSSIVFEDINARSYFTQNSFKVKLGARSSMFEHLVFKADFDQSQNKGSAKLEIQKLNPTRMLNEYLKKRNCNYSIQDSMADMQIEVQRPGQDLWQGDMLLKVSEFDFFAADQEFNYPDQLVHLSMDADADNFNVELKESRLLASGLKLNGEMLWELKNDQLQLSLDGKHGHIGQMRRLALTLAGNQVEVQDVFQVLEQGYVPDFQVLVQGKGWEAMADFRNWFVQGRINKGQMFIPEVNLRLKQTRAEAKIKDEILEARDIAAFYGQTEVQNGSFDLDMSDESLLLRVSTDLRVDLAQLPAMLENVIADSSFSNVFDELNSISGQAEAKLAIQGPVSDLQVSTQVSAFQLKAEHQKFPLELEISKGQFAFDLTAMSLQNVSARLGSSNFSGVMGSWEYGLDSMLNVKAAQSEVFLADVSTLANKFDALNKEFLALDSLQGKLDISQLQVQGPAHKPLKWEVLLKAGLNKLSLNSPYLPQGLVLDQGKLDWQQEEISLQDCMFSFAGIKGQLGLEISTDLKSISLLNLNLQGEINDKIQNWFFEKYSVPEILELNTPARVKQMQLRWKPEEFTQLNATICSPEDNILEYHYLDVQKGQNEQSFVLRDKLSEAVVSVNWDKSNFQAGFGGEIYEQTLAGLLKQNNILQGRIQGQDAVLDFDLKDPMRSRMQGQLQGRGLLVPINKSEFIMISNLDLQGLEKRLLIKSMDFKYDKSNYTLQGEMDYYDQGGQFDLILNGPELDWQYLESVKQKISSDVKETGWNFESVSGLQGKLNVILDNFSYKDYVLKPFKCEIQFFKDKKISLNVSDTRFCNLDVNGTLGITPQDIDLSFKSFNQDKELKSVTACLFSNSSIISGPFRFKANVQGKAKAENIKDCLEGGFELQAKEGRIHRWGFLAKVFSMLNVAEVFQGKLPDLKKQGFVYDTLESSGNLSNGNLLVLERTVMKGPSMTLVLGGVVNIEQESMDIQLLVAPLPTVDWFIDKIPIVRHILGGTLVAVPVRVHGPWSDPHIVPLSPTSVGTRVLDMLKRTLELPTKLIHPFD